MVPILKPLIVNYAKANIQVVAGVPVNLFMLTVC